MINESGWPEVARRLSLAALSERQEPGLSDLCRWPNGDFSVFRAGQIPLGYSALRVWHAPCCLFFIEGGKAWAQI
jgi:hypothetical protein